MNALARDDDTERRAPFDRRAYDISTKEYVDALVARIDHRASRMDASIQYFGEKLGACMTEERWEHHYRDLTQRLVETERQITAHAAGPGHVDVLDRLTDLERRALTRDKFEQEHGDVLARIAALERVESNTEAVATWRQRYRAITIALAGTVIAFGTFVVYVLIAFVK